MKMKQKFLLGVSIIFISLPIAQVALAPMDHIIANLSKCPEEILARLDERELQNPPSKIVIKPWRGRHNVHGIFMLPVEDKSSKMLVLHVPGSGTYCGGSQDVGTSFEGVEAQPGYYLLRGNFRTRTATWLIARGFVNQLKDSHNWRLINH